MILPRDVFQGRHFTRKWERLKVTVTFVGLALILQCYTLLFHLALS